MKHTPGPWHVRPDPQEFEAIIYAPNGTFIGHVIACDVRDANARLIAAAPELLEACKLALNAFERNWAIDWHILEAAIAKAEGDDQ